MIKKAVKLKENLIKSNYFKLKKYTPHLFMAFLKPPFG